jgi:ubiquinone/menaquinone biosynthesis C-methylase UbiE
MKNKELWRESKYIKTKKGHWQSSKNTDELSVSSRLIANLVVQWYEQHVPQYVRGRLLDLGCGKVPLFGMYHPYVTEIHCVDWENSLHKNAYLDIACDINKPLPFPDNYFDTIILSDVLEHIIEPKLLFGEMYRILQTNGKILLNVPFYYPIHEAPYDYFRYTQFTLQKFADEAHLKIVKLSDAGGIVTWIDLTSKLLAGFPVVGRCMATILQNMAYFVLKRKRQKQTFSTFPLAYCAIIEK